jgi:hypothetical protein
MDARKFCQINLDLHYPQGFQLSVLSTTFRGFVSLDKGVTATLSALYYFSGRELLPQSIAWILIRLHFSEPKPGYNIDHVPRT